MSAAKRRFATSLSSLSTATAPTAEPGGAPAPSGVPVGMPEEPAPAIDAGAESPARKKGPLRWPVRVPLNIDDDMRRALELARIDDRIDTTTRLRAMIKLWQEDERLRARINKRAQGTDVKPG